MSEKETTKQRMINATKELICQGKKPSEITVADITDKANVGNGMVNYHFQSKDNLMREAVRDVTVCAKKHLTEKLKPFANASVEQRLAIILKEVLDFFSQNAEISKIAILDNLENDEGIPHLLSDVTVFSDCLEELCENNTCSVGMKTFIVVGFINYIFLKAKIIKEETGFDFYDKLERDTAVDNFVRELICNNKKQ
jgi:AcrR family transcriptional regulator